MLLVFRKGLSMHYMATTNRLTNGNCPATPLKFDDRCPFVILAFKMNWNIGILISVYLSVISSLPCVKFW